MLSSYFGFGKDCGENQEGTSSQLQVQNSQTTPHVGDDDKPHISDQDDLEEDYLIDAQVSWNDIIDLGDNAIDDNAWKGKGKARSKKDQPQSKRDWEWDMSMRNFQINWALKYPFIELVENPIEGEPPIEHKCKICTWKHNKEIRLRLKFDTIEKHMDKVYEKKMIDKNKNEAY